MSTPASESGERHEPAASAPRISTRAFTIGALLACFVIACFVSLAASGSPDGLEYVAGSSGFLDSADESATAGSPLADYETAGIELSWLSIAIAGAIGCVVTFGGAWVLGLATKRRRVDVRTTE